MNKTIQKLKDQIKYHQDKLNQYNQVLALIQEHPQVEQALGNLLEALEKANLI